MFIIFIRSRQVGTHLFIIKCNVTLFFLDVFFYIIDVDFFQQRQNYELKMELVKNSEDLFSFVQ